MEIIIFFTNKNKLGAVDVAFPFELSEAAPSYEYRFQDDKIILVINDMINEEAISTILSAYSNITKLYYIHHSLPSGSVKKMIKDICNNRKISLIPQSDIHEYGKSKFYHLVGHFCAKNAILKLDFFEDLKIKFSYDEVLEKKLILLHDCLHNESAATTDTSWLTEEQKTIVRFLSVQKDNLDEDYIEALTELRKSLLGS
jgi:hypothetical protein